ncbi:MAG: phosphoglucomutase [Pseudomonadota bacterium]|jgi:phosphoglucomutase
MSKPQSGQIAPKEILENIPSLINDYYVKNPDINNIDNLISFGTSGHRGSSKISSFNENHILAVTQAVCEYRKSVGIDGVLYIGKDTHALSTPAETTAIRVCAANGVKVRIAANSGYVPTPVISFSILRHNENEKSIADGVVITPSHNPPADGGFKYNPPNGGPADTDVTSVIEKRANEILKDGLKDVKVLSLEDALKSDFVEEFDFITPYVKALINVVDIDAIKAANLKIGVDPLGGSGIEVYQKINEIYGLNLEILNEFVDPTFSFMTLDHDLKIRMDCSSPYAMASLIGLKDKFDIAFANDPDFDRHGIVTKSVGLMNPNHYLSVAIWYLSQYRTEWKKELKIGKTVVSSSMIDRVCASINKKILEVPVGFKWFVQGLFNGELAFGGEESAGASFLQKNGKVWSTDKDGIILNLLAAEITAKLNKDPGIIYKEFEEKFGKAYYKRVDAPATNEIKAKIKALQPEDLKADTLGGEKITAILTKASGHSIGGLKVCTTNGWFAARPSGTEQIYKIYAESFISLEHLECLINEAKELIAAL